MLITLKISICFTRSGGSINIPDYLENHKIPKAINNGRKNGHATKLAPSERWHGIIKANTHSSRTFHGSFTVANNRHPLFPLAINSPQSGTNEWIYKHFKHNIDSIRISIACFFFSFLGVIVRKI